MSQLGRALFTPYLIDFLLKNQLVETREGQAQKKANSPIKS